MPTAPPGSTPVKVAGADCAPQPLRPPPLLLPVDRPEHRFAQAALAACDNTLPLPLASSIVVVLTLCRCCPHGCGRARAAARPEPLGAFLSHPALNEQGRRRAPLPRMNAWHPLRISQQLHVVLETSNQSNRPLGGRPRASGIRIEQRQNRPHGVAFDDADVAFPKVESDRLIVPDQVWCRNATAPSSCVCGYLCPDYSIPCSPATAVGARRHATRDHFDSEELSRAGTPVDTAPSRDRSRTNDSALSRVV